MTPENLLDQLDGWGIQHTTVEHTAVFTVEESKALGLGLSSDGSTKNLYLRDKKKKNFLFTAHEDSIVELDRLPEIFGSKRLSFGSPDRLDEFLGIKPGSVSPLALINDSEGLVEFWIDAKLMDAEQVHCHPLENTLTSSINPDDLAKFVEKSGHTLNVCEL